MPTLTTPPKNTRRLRSTTLAAMALASVTLLGGCSIWPKALTFSSDPDPVPEQPAPAASAPVAAAPAPVEAKPVVTSTAIAQPQVTPAPAPVVAAPETKVPAAPAVAVARTAPAAELAPGFYINVGVFAVSANGTRAYHKLEKAGLPVFSDGVQSKKGPATRVRVGPFPTQAKADAAAKKIHALKLDAVVFHH
jgi:cell division septation protein DedD